MNYWLIVFTEQTWEEFLKREDHTVGFNFNRINSVKKIQKGDYLICYISKLHTFRAILEVTSETYTDKTQLWEARIFPVRLKVKPISLLGPREEISIYDLKSRLTFFQDLKQPLGWTHKIRSSPTRWSNYDGEVILEAIQNNKTIEKNNA